MARKMSKKMTSKRKMTTTKKGPNTAALMPMNNQSYMQGQVIGQGTATAIPALHDCATLTPGWTSYNMGVGPNQ